MSLLRYGKNEPIQKIKIPDFPIPDTDYRKYYLADNGKFSLEGSPRETSSVSYNAEDGSMVTFTHTFDQRTQLVGLPKAVIHVSCDELNDMCLFLQLRKLDIEGNPLIHLTVPFSRAPIDDPKDAPSNGLITYNGPIGCLRASHRHIEPSKSIHPNYPFHPHDRVELVPRGQIVEMEIGIWFMGLQYEQGESIRLDISGSNPLWPELSTSNAEPMNKGQHTVHFGGSHASHLILPHVSLDIASK
jgi:predicted acyl esterase